MVPGAGVEPARCFHRGILSPLRLPISPPGLVLDGLLKSCPLSIVSVVRGTTVNQGEILFKQE